jgi:HEAT repeat protein
VPGTTNPSQPAQPTQPAQPNQPQPAVPQPSVPTPGTETFDVPVPAAQNPNNVIGYMKGQFFSSLSGGPMIWQSWWEQHCLHYLKWREPISWVTVKNTGETISVASEVQKKMIQEVFIPCLKEDKNAIARASAALALAKMEDQSSLAALKEALNQDKDFDVKRTVAFSLAMLQDKETINEIIELTNNNQAKFSKFLDRPAALLILGYIKNPSVLESINGVFDPKKKSDTETQCAALLALANFKDKSYIPLIGNILNDKSKDANIRIYAALALGFIKDPSALPELKKALDEKDNSIRSSAVMALGMIKSPDSKNDLINLLNKDKNAEVDRKSVV